MAEGGFDYWGQRDWLKRIHQLKKELRSTAVEPSLKIPEPTQTYGVEFNSKRGRNRRQLPVLKAKSLPRSPLASR
ncbi:MAG: hypothetical protein QNJ46_25005 [Leptolyngbyaceae cyanobacterium MO_188.B28]|nr:hypothetical protein [Leptolyngbyaceae cyanobacterium MO_188.B28]